MTRDYWNFYWPLAITQVALILIYQVFNAILARYPDAERELMAFALASSTYTMLQVGTLFMPQLVVVYAKNAASRTVVIRFCLVIGVLFMLPLLILGSTRIGATLLSHLYNIEGQVLNDVVDYLFLLSPLILVRVALNYFTGLLTQAKRTKLVSVGALIGVGCSISLALFGFQSGWAALPTMASAQICATLVPTLFCALIYPKLERPADDQTVATPSFGELFSFFWPVSLSSVSFGASRPIIFAYASRMPDATVIIASLRVAFDLFMLAQSAANQFRSFLPTFGLERLAEKRRFMGVVTLGMAFLLVLCGLPPLKQLIFVQLIGLNPALAGHSAAALLVLAAAPIALVVRNYYHGILMVHKMTQSMALGSLLRVALIWFSSALFLEWGWLSTTGGALILLLGFVIETLTVVIRARRLENV